MFKKEYYFYETCENWPKSDVVCSGGLIDLVENAKEITRKTFTKHTNREDLALVESNFKYGDWLQMKDDWHVSYFKSKLHGRVVYGFRHSAIEYVFVNWDLT